MVDTLFSNAGTFLVAAGTFLVAIVTLVVAILVLRASRRTAGLSEERMQYLSEERDRLAFLREEHRTLEEELRQERQEAQERAERAERERPAKAPSGSSSCLPRRRKGSASSAWKPSDTQGSWGKR